MARVTPGTMIVAVFAVLFGLVAAYSVQRYIKAEPAAPAPPPAEQPDPSRFVPMASVDLVPGKRLSLGDIMLVRMTPDEIKQRNIAPDYMTDPSQIIGRILKTPLKKGEPFQTTSLYPEGMGPSVAERLKPGFRAVTVPIEMVGAVAGFAGPGSIVDVLFRSKDTEDSPSATVTLLEAVEVLALGDAILPGTQGNGKVNTVTLAVTPQQSAALKVVEGYGELSLSIRNPEDARVASNSRPLTLDGLLGLPRKPEPFRAEIYRGGSRQTVTFDGEQVAEERFGGLPITATPERKPVESSVAAVPEDQR